MDAVLTVRLWGCDDTADTHFTRIKALVDEIEAALSRTREESDVSRINRERSAGELSPHTLSVLTTAHRVMLATSGAYLPTMGAISDLWRAAGEENVLPNNDTLQAALAAAREGFTLENGVCTLSAEGALLDLGGIGKGYAIDCVLAYLRDAGVTGALCSFGSSVATLGEKSDASPFRISLRSPADANATVGMLISPVGVLSVSGDYERYVTVGGVRYHHIIDPATGYPAASGISSASVLAAGGAYSDALSTALLVMGKEKAAALVEGLQVEAIFITADGTLTHTTGLNGIFERN
jgi:thiamine biosynthesis lipoprotein